MRFALATGLDLSMSLRRPHRFLSAAHQTADRLAGIVETFVLASRKGDRKRDRGLRRRGVEVRKCGLSRVLAPLPAASRQDERVRDPVRAPNVLPASDANRCCSPDVASLTNASMLRPAKGFGARCTSGRSTTTVARSGALCAANAISPPDDPSWLILLHSDISQRPELAFDRKGNNMPAIPKSSNNVWELDT